jgi:hypothetical protein
LRAAFRVVEHGEGVARLLGRQADRAAGDRCRGHGLRGGGNSRRRADDEEKEKPDVK